MSNFTESVIEDAALTWPKGLGYAELHGSARRLLDTQIRNLRIYAICVYSRP